MSQDLDSENAKLVTLAQSASARTGRPAAAVRDDIGRTYVAASVTLTSLSLTAVQAAAAAALSSGATVVKAVALIGADYAPVDIAVLTELGNPLLVTA